MGIPTFYINSGVLLNSFIKSIFDPKNEDRKKRMDLGALRTVYHSIDLLAISVVGEYVWIGNHWTAGLDTKGW